MAHRIKKYCFLFLFLPIIVHAQIIEISTNLSLGERYISYIDSPTNTIYYRIKNFYENQPSSWWLVFPAFPYNCTSNNGVISWTHPFPAKYHNEEMMEYSIRPAYSIRIKWKAPPEPNIEHYEFHFCGTGYRALPYRIVTGFETNVVSPKLNPDYLPYYIQIYKVLTNVDQIFRSQLLITNITIINLPQDTIVFAPINFKKL